MANLPRTPDQEAEAPRLRPLLIAAFPAAAELLARLWARKSDTQLLGRTEFEVRDAVHRRGAKAIATALRERNQGGTAAPA